MPAPRGCDECRAAHVKCNGQRPICSRCLRLRLDCKGYRDANVLVIRDENAIAAENSRRSRRPANTPVLTTIHKRRAQRYIAPYHLSSTEQLPWLHAPLPRTLQPKIGDIAVAKFFANYVLFPSSHFVNDGYLSDLPHFFAKTSNGSALQLAVDSCSLASISNTTKSLEIKVRAQQLYGEALRALRTAASDRSLALQDETLMCILVLDFYILFMEDAPPLISPHWQGIAPILRIRGAQQLHSTVGWNLFRVAHRRLQFRKLLLREEPMAESYQLISTLSHTFTESGLATYALQTSQLCADARMTLDRTPDSPSYEARGNDVERIVAGLHDVDRNMISWASTVPPIWKPKVRNGSSRSSPAGSHYKDLVMHVGPLIYHDIWIANSWNYHRTCRVILHETLVQCLTSEQASTVIPEIAKQVADSQQAAMELMELMLATLPYLMGIIDSQGNNDPGAMHAKDLGVYYAFLAVQVVAASPLATPEQKQRARAILAEAMTRLR